MIGHADAHYFYFGKTAARLDDIANFVPSRLTALGIVATSYWKNGADPQGAWKTWQRDGDKHKSPNAGQPESSMSGAIHARLGGDNTYVGEIIHAPQMGEEFTPPSVAQARKALRLVSAVTLFRVACSILIAECTKSRARRSAPQ